MNRQHLVREIYGFNVNEVQFNEYVFNHLRNQYRRDLGCGDITTDTLFDSTTNVQAEIIAKGDGVIAGANHIKRFFGSKNVAVQTLYRDGQYVEAGQVVMQLSGDARNILKMERTALDHMQVLSGIATNAQRYSALISDYNALVAGTRKTRSDKKIEKYALSVGGALAHRMNLNDFPMVKENHFAVLRNRGITNPHAYAVSQIYFADARAFEIEVASTDQIPEILGALTRLKNSRGTKQPILMLDNFTPEQVSEIIDSYRLQDYALIEASGGVTIDNLVDYAKAGVDVISTSAMQREAQPLDLSLLIR